MPIPFTAFISPGGGELIMIMLVLILLFGAKDAPRILRTIQTFLDKMQRSAADFRYKMMYSDLHQNTTDDEPYDVDEVYASNEDEDPFHDGDVPSEDENDQETGDRNQEEEADPKTVPPESETENGYDEKPVS